jgi:membrane-bound lytic murein transglycosylase D
MARTTVFLSTILLGWMNIPAQAGLVSDAQNLWPVMSQHFTIPSDAGKETVRRQIDIDLQHPKYIRRLTQNARPYLFSVYKETEKKHLPAELALLPMIESDYMPHGTSMVGAVGLWQLMPGTANDYGLKMNQWYDGRRNTAASTKAALSFLSYLYETFDHNWLLALAAYNAGPGTVMEAINYNKEHGEPTNFWALHLPKETQAYIPKLLALAAIIQHPSSYGIHLSPVPNEPVTTTVTLKKQIPLTKIATMAHTTVSTVKKLNPALRQSATPPHQSIGLVLPVNTKTAFEAHLKAQGAIDAAVAAKKMAPYTVKHGDSLSSIAKKFNTSVDVLSEVNQIHNGFIKLNQAILVPKIFGKTVAKKAPQVPHKTVVAKKTVHTYVVRHGDELRHLATRFHTSIVALKRDNHLHSNNLQVGQHLVV